MKGALTVDVARPPAEVFERLASPETLLRGVREVSGLRRTSGRGAAGTTYEGTVKAGGKSERATIEVLEHEEPRRIAYAVEGRPGAVTIDVRLSPRSGGKATRLEGSYEVAIAGALRFVAGPLLKAWLRRNEDRLADRIREALEAPDTRGRRSRR